MNRASLIQMLKATAPSSRWWGPAGGHVSLASVVADPETHGLKDLLVSHPSNPFEFLPPEWCTSGSSSAFAAPTPDPGPDRVASFEGCRFIGLDGLLVTRADLLLRESVMQPGGDYDAHPAMRSPWYGPVRRVRKKVAIIASRFSNNYYHWLFDILPRFEVVRQAGVAVDAYYLHVGGKFQRESLEMLGIPSDALMPALPRAQFAADQIVFPLVPGGLECVPAWVARHLREKLLGNKARNTDRLLYISRSKSRYRKVTNEDDIRRFLEQRGFETIFMEELGFREQVETLASARAVVAAHGAGLANILFCPSGTPVIECFRGDYVNALYFRLARLCGHPYAAVVAAGDESTLTGMNQLRVGASFAIPMDELGEALNSMRI